MSSVKSDQHADEDPKEEELNASDKVELEEKVTTIPPLDAVIAKDEILRHHDALRQRTEELLDHEAGLREENLCLKFEVDFWKNEWRNTLGLRSEVVSVQKEVERLKIEWRRTYHLQKNQVEQLKSESRMAKPARDGVNAQGQQMVGTHQCSKQQTRNVPVDVVRSTHETVKRGRFWHTFGQANHEKIGVVQESRRKDLLRKEKEDMRNAWEAEEQHKAVAKRKEFAKETKPQREREPKRTKRGNEQDDCEELEGKDSKAKGELHRVRASTKVPSRSQPIQYDDDKTPQQGVSSPTLSAPSTVSSDQDCGEYSDRICVPDSDFYDFDCCRSEKHIHAGQIWALYDEQDGLPRLYALVSRVTVGPFEAHIKWLDHCPETLEEKARTESSSLSITCGLFKMDRSSHVMRHVNTFAHFVTNIEVRGPVKVYPRRGQVWAVYKYSNKEERQAGGSRCIGKGTEPKFEMVEILSEFCCHEGVRTGKLLKVKGFKSVFYKQAGIEAFRSFKPCELVEFSHSVPSHRIEQSEIEAHGFPRGTLELDPAAIPAHLLGNA